MVDAHAPVALWRSVRSLREFRLRRTADAARAIEHDHRVFAAAEDIDIILAIDTDRREAERDLLVALARACPTLALRLVDAPR